VYIAKSVSHFGGKINLACIIFAVKKGGCLAKHFEE
jgi:hypothetical protein